jgi:transcriptional regulator with XRE-family HTH domain
MSIRLRRMTLPELLERYRVYTIRELARRTGLSRQQAWTLWHGRARLGRLNLERFHTKLGIPLEELLQVDSVPAVKRPQTTPPRPRGRPRKAPSSEEPSADRFGWGPRDITITSPGDEEDG